MELMLRSLKGIAAQVLLLALKGLRRVRMWEGTSFLLPLVPPLSSPLKAGKRRMWFAEREPRHL